MVVPLMLVLAFCFAAACFLLTQWPTQTAGQQTADASKTSGEETKTKKKKKRGKRKPKKKGTQDDDEGEEEEDEDRGAEQKNEPPEPEAPKAEEMPPIEDEKASEEEREEEKEVEEEAELVVEDVQPEEEEPVEAPVEEDALAEEGQKMTKNQRKRLNERKKKAAAAAAAAQAAGGEEAAPTEGTAEAAADAVDEDDAKAEGEVDQADVPEVETAAVATSDSEASGAFAASTPAVSSVRSNSILQQMFSLTVSREPWTPEIEAARKRLTKKIRQIEDLRAKQQSGTTLNADQTAKLEGEAALRAELLALPMRPEASAVEPPAKGKAPAPEATPAEVEELLEMDFEDDFDQLSDQDESAEEEIDEVEVQRLAKLSYEDRMSEMRALLADKPAEDDAVYEGWTHVQMPAGAPAAESVPGWF